MVCLMKWWIYLSDSVSVNCCAVAGVPLQEKQLSQEVLRVFSGKHLLCRHMQVIFCPQDISVALEVTLTHLVPQHIQMR